MHSSGNGPDSQGAPEIRSADSDIKGLQRAAIVLVCEHASNHIPAEFNGLGLTADQQLSHIAWDPGALGVATLLRDQLDATLVDCRTSRLVYDCNRPPEAADAMPERSEIHTIPGNVDLTESAKNDRIERYYRPFESRIAAAVAGAIARSMPVFLVTIHSFTPVYRGEQRSTQVGILHDSDTRLADSLLRTAQRHTALLVHRNQPYSPTDGVTHTLLRHGLENGLMNVMIEIRNDLIITRQQQQAMATLLCCWLTCALGEVT